jgi:acetoin utilization deacetylase AcuC-like enzyme
VLSSIPYVWSDAYDAHQAGGEVWVGVRTAGTEVAERMERIRDALRDAGARERPAQQHPDRHLLAVHDAELLDYLRTAWDAWQRASLTEDPGQDRVVPYLFPHPGLLDGLPAREPAAATARAGRFAYDTMTLIGPGTWPGARAAADVALTAVDLLVAGEPLAYACCRPPGHHATRSAFGGSCYLNNSAIAAAALSDRRSGVRVAVLDIDAHHGNGTQSIFYATAEVLTGSVHVDPGAGWFPHYVGFGAEAGVGAGVGANLNLPLTPGAGDELWLGAVDELCRWVSGSGAAALVIALGVDAAADDPESPLEVSIDAYREAGRRLGSIGLPTVAVQEGGYELESLGGLVTATLAGLAAGRSASG